MQACVEFYTLDEMHTARTLLWKSANHDIIGEEMKRRNSVKGTEASKIVSDIVEAIKKLDNVRAMPSFGVSAKQLNRIPRAAARELLPISICERLGILEEQSKQMQKLVESLFSTSTQNSQGITESAAVSRGEQNPGLPKDPALPRQYADVARSSSQEVVDDGFTTVKKKKAKKRANKKKKSVQGTSDSSDNCFTAGANTICVQITNVGPKETTNTVRDYVKMKNIEPVKIEDTSSVGWETKRFLITVSQENKSLVLEPAFWPKRTYFKQWFHRRQTSSRDGASSK